MEGEAVLGAGLGDAPVGRARFGVNDAWGVRPSGPGSTPGDGVDKDAAGSSRAGVAQRAAVEGEHVKDTEGTASLVEAEGDRIAFDAFSLAVRVVMHAFGIDAPGSEFERPWALLREIAEGRTTLASPAEMVAKFPDMRDFVYDRVNRVVENDRVVAERVLRGLGRAF
jgi:hypothetical protein